MVREFHEHRACMKFLEMSEKISNLVAFSVSSCGNGEVLWFVAKRPGWELWKPRLSDVLSASLWAVTPSSAEPVPWPTRKYRQSWNLWLYIIQTLPLAVKKEFLLLHERACSPVTFCCECYLFQRKNAFLKRFDNEDVTLFLVFPQNKAFCYYNI